MRSTIIHLSPRSYGLLLCAFLWGLVGYSLIYGVRVHVPGTWHDGVPLGVRVAEWLVPAALAVVLHRSPRHDWIALMLLLLGPMQRMFSYLTSWVLFLTGHEGFEDGWFAAALYLALIGIVGLTATIRQTPHLDQGGDHRDYS